MALAIGPGMLRRSLALAAFGALCLAAPGDAAAGGAWLPGAGQGPVEQRVAVSVGPDRVTLWTSVRFDGAAGAVGILVPVPPLSAIDVSSDAWLEALEVATAPRVFPPGGISPYCPGEQGDPDPLHVAGHVDHEATLAPSEVSVLPDAGAVALWAASAGLSLSADAASKLAALQGMRFLAARFAAPGGAAVTKTLRIAMPGAEAKLPLALTQAGGVDLLVTTWLVGAGRGALVGAAPVVVEGSSVTWSAGPQSTDYEAARMSALAAAPAGGAVLECSSHEALGYNIALGGSASIDGVATTYFERADAYGNASGDPAVCTALAAAALASSSPVSASCPRGDYGVVDAPNDCVEAPLPGETEPDKLRCGPVADDLAVALSGLTPSGAWLTRLSLRVGAGQVGVDVPIAFGVEAPVTPVLDAGSVSLSECGEKDAGPDGATTGPGGTGASTSSGGQSSGTTSPSGASAGAGAGAGGTIVVHSDYPVGVGCDCSGTADTYVDEGGGGYGGYDDSYYAEDDGCSSDTTDTSGNYEDDSCSGDTTDTGGSGDSCDGGDSSGSDGCSSDTSGGSSGCSSDSGGSSGCSNSGGGEDCSVAGNASQRARKRRMPKLSAVALAVLAVLAPLRRARRPKRGPRGPKRDPRRAGAPSGRGRR